MGFAGLFFDADKYIRRVESPRVKKTLGRKEQVVTYIQKYFEEYSPDYLDEVYNSCIRYIDESFAEPNASENEVTSPEVQAVTTIIMWLESYIKQGSLDKLKYMRVLAAKEAFKLYCGMISKVMELGIIDRRTAKSRITRFYRECGLG